MLDVETLSGDWLLEDSREEALRDGMFDSAGYLARLTGKAFIQSYENLLHQKTS
jgi:hypothetical protein